MIFDIKVEWIDAGWHVTYPLTDPTTGKPVTRVLPACGARAYPQPPSNETKLLDAADPHFGLCTTADDKRIKELLDDFSEKDPIRTRSDGLQVLGGYLFATLIGNAIWTEIKRAAQGKPIELGLSWDRAELSALPWELMHDCGTFLAQQPGVAIIRRVHSPRLLVDPQQHLASPPIVLIAVGTDLNNEDIQAGAEYVRMVQSLRNARLDLSLRTFLLVDASQPKIETALTELRPDIVHFVCHGDIDADEKPYLVILNEDDRRSPQNVYATSLTTMLGKAPPRVVVLTACNSARVATSSSGQIATPLAAELVRFGIPLVVGMGGRINDQACRLFTRKFYEALLENGDVAQATAEGRRAALAGSAYDPLRVIDWSLPTLFFSDQLRDTSIPIILHTKEQAWNGLAVDHESRFPPFCDRSQHLARFDVLMASAAVQRAVVRASIQAIMLSYGRADGGTYGCTRVLKECAAKAIRDGHMVVFVQPKSDAEGRPKAPDDLPRFFAEALVRALSTFKLRCPRCAGDARGSGSCDACKPVHAARNAAELSEQSVQDQAVALLSAFETILQWGRGIREPKKPEDMKLILVIEDLQVFGPRPLRSLLYEYLPTFRGSPADSIRFLLSYSNTELAVEDVSSSKLVSDWLSETPWVDDELIVGRLTGPEEEVAYEHYLRNFYDQSAKARRPVAIAQNRDNVLRLLRAQLEGVPSRFKGRAEYILVAVSAFEMAGYVVPADDDDVLRKAQPAAGGSL